MPAQVSTETVETKVSGYLANRRRENSEKQRNLTEGASAELVRQTPKNGQRGKRALVLLLEDKFPGYHAVVKMAEHAMSLSKIADDNPLDATAHANAVTAHEKVAKYVAPQLKAIDMTSQGEQIHFGFQINLANITEE